MAGYVNPFLSSYLPGMFWPAELAVFGRTVTYTPKNSAAQPVSLTVLWKEGASDEDVSPGRYSHIDAQNADLAVPPVRGDIVQSNGKNYQVVRIEALITGYSVIVLQEAGATP